MTFFIMGNDCNHVQISSLQMITNVYYMLLMPSLALSKGFKKSSFTDSQAHDLASRFGNENSFVRRDNCIRSSGFGARGGT